MPIRVRNCFSLLLIVIVLAAATARAELHPNERPGFDAGKVFDMHGIDNINTFNGNLLITIPLGHSYRASNSLSYGFTLVYNSKVWMPVQGSDLTAILTTRSNAGVGWLVSLGTLIGDTDLTNDSTVNMKDKSWLYQAPDGSVRHFVPAGFANQWGNVLVSGDSSGFLRLSTTGYAEKELEFPDGSVHTFAKGDGDAGWRLTGMRDQFHNKVSVMYCPGDSRCGALPAGISEMWVVTQTFGRPVRDGEGNYTVDGTVERRHELEFTVHPEARYSELQAPRVLRKVRLNANSSEARAEYTFHYDNAPVNLEPPGWDRPSATTVGDRKGFLLRSVSFPTGETYSMTYNEWPLGGSCPVSNCISNGYLTQLTLPTGGSLRYAYKELQIRGSAIAGEWFTKLYADPNHDRAYFPEPRMEVAEHPVMVETRVVADADGNPRETWFYDHHFLGHFTCPDVVVEGLPFRFIPTLAAVVTGPDGASTVTYYNIYNAPNGHCADDPNGWSLNGSQLYEEYGLPITRNVKNGEGERLRFLSTAVLPSRPAPGGPVMTHFPGAVRSHYVRYRPYTARSGIHQYEVGSKTVYENDTCGSEKCYKEVIRRNFDGWGHFRQLSTGSNFGGVLRTNDPFEQPDGNFETQFTGYTGWPHGPDSPIKPWFLDLYKEQCTRQESTIGREITSCADLSPGLTRKYTFSPVTGFLESVRSEGGAVVAPDQLAALRVDYTRTLWGDVAEERHFGGVHDKNATDTEPAYRILHTSFPVIGRVQSEIPGTNFRLLDLVRDNATGLIRTSYDSAGVPTEYRHDVLGRLSFMQTRGTYAVHYRYFPWTGSNRPATVEMQQGPAGDDTISSFEYDYMGRIVREKNTLPDGTKNLRVTVFNAKGQRASVSEVVPDGTTPNATTRFTYDLFGRVRTATTPDGTIVTTSYKGDGERELEKTVSRSSLGLVRELYDGKGRLWAIVERSGTTRGSLDAPAQATGAPVITTYGYDHGGRLERVHMTPEDRSVSQRRLFRHNDFGFLVSELHPEKSAPVEYFGYDVRGQFGRKKEGNASDLTYLYDAAGRLTEVKDTTTNQLVTKYVFGQSGEARGRLISDERHNAVDVNGQTADVKVEQAYQYENARVIARDTKISIDGSPVKTFRQEFDYTERGELSKLVYPACEGCPGSPRTIENVFRRGYLTGVTGFAQLSYHHNGLVQTVGHISRDGRIRQHDEHKLDPFGLPRLSEIDFVRCGPAIAGHQPEDAVQSENGARLFITPPAGATSYQWYEVRGGVEVKLDGRIEPQLLIPRGTEPRTFFVRVGDGTCEVDSRRATVRVPCDNIRITEQPEDRNVLRGQTATFTVTADGGGGTVRYQWYVGQRWDTRAPIASATSASFTTDAMSVTTPFWIEISNASRSCVIASETVYAHVCPPVLILAEPSDHLPVSGEAAAIVKVAGEEPFAYDVVLTGVTSQTACQGRSGYQWLNERCVSRSPETSNVLTVRRTGEGSDLYVVHVRSACGAETTTREFRLGTCGTACEDFAVDVQPHVSFIAQPGQNTSIGVAEPAGDFTFEWYTGSGVRLAQATRSIEVSAGIDGASYYVRVTRNLPEGSTATPKSVTSAPVYVYVEGTCALNSVQVTPTTAIIGGAPVQLTAAADWYNVQYQWFRGDSGNTSEPAGTGRTITVADPGRFWVRAVSNCGRTVDSTAVSVSSASCAPIEIRSMTPPPELEIDADTPVVLSLETSAQSNVTTHFWHAGPRGEDALGVSPHDPKGPKTVWPRQTELYRARAVSPCSSQWSPAVLVHVVSCGPVRFTTAPPERVLAIKAHNETSAPPVTLSATVNEAVTFEWYKGPSGDMHQSTRVSRVEGVTSTSYATGAIEETTLYWVRAITATGCKFDSRTIRVEICTPPVILQTTPRSVNIPAGAGTWIGFNAAGTGLQYRWFAGESGDESNPVTGSWWGPNLFVRPNVTSRYWLQVWNDDCTGARANSPTYTVSICPVITQQPSSGPIVAGNPATLSITAQGSELQYKWYMGSYEDRTASQLIGTSATVTTPAITQPTTIWCEVLSGSCSVRSVPVQVRLCDLSASWDPMNFSANAHRGQRQTMTVVPQPAGTYTYTWYTGSWQDVPHSAPIAGPQSSAALSVEPAVTTSYWVRVTDTATGCYAYTPVRTIDVCLPRITAEPQDALANPSATLTVQSDLENVQYQWYEGSSTPIPNATSPTLTVTPTAATTTYWVRVTGSCGVPVNSRVVTVTRCNAPAITAPLNRPKTHGEAATLSFTASGTDLRYEWYQGAAGTTSGGVLSTSATLTVAPSVTTDYWVRIIGACGTLDAGTRVSVYPAVSGPSSTRITKNTAATFTVSASGTQLSYEWRQGTSGQMSPVLSGNASYTTPSLSATTSYWVRVYSGDAYVDSGTVVAEVCPPPVLEIANPRQTSNAEVTLSVANPIAGELYTFYRGAAGDTSQPLNSPAASATMKVYPRETTTYWVRSSNAQCTGDSNAVVAAVCIPDIVQQPQNLSINEGMSVAVSVSATGTAPLSYQWYTGTPDGASAPISGGTTNWIAVAPAETTSYWVRITSSCGAVNSAPATVMVCKPPRITHQPASPAAILPQTSATLEVGATGVGLWYQWYALGDTGWQPVGANSPTLTVSPSETTHYFVYVASQCGALNSNAVTVSVYPAITQQPQSSIVPAGGSATLTVQASGRYLQYQWYRNGLDQPVGNGTPSYTTGPVSADTRFFCVVSSVNARTTSAEAWVRICTPPSIESAGVTPLAGGCKIVSVVVPESERSQVTYAWYRGAAGDTSTLQSTSASFQSCSTTTTPYWCRITNTATGCTRDTDTITVTP
jgi:YD repeat-containing protein